MGTSIIVVKRLFFVVVFCLLVVGLSGQKYSVESLIQENGGVGWYGEEWDVGIVCLRPDSLFRGRQLSKEELRASRDVFFYGRGDTLYLLYDAADSLQRLSDKQCEWKLRPLTQEERDREREKRIERQVFPEIDRMSVPDSVKIFLDFKPETVLVVDSLFLRQKKPATRAEWAAFVKRETRRRIMEFARTGNLRWDFGLGYLFWDYFDEVFLLVPQDNGNFGLYHIR